MWVTTSNGIGINNLLYVYIVSGSKLANTSKENELRMTAFSFGNSLALKNPEKSTSSMYVPPVQIQFQYIFPIFPVLALLSTKPCSDGTQEHFVVDLLAGSFRKRVDGLTSLSSQFESFL